MKLILVEDKDPKKKAELLKKCDLISFRYYDGKIRMFAVFLGKNDKK